jgi:hypothetical protein
MRSNNGFAYFLVTRGGSSQQRVKLPVVATSDRDPILVSQLADRGVRGEHRRVGYRLTGYLATLGERSSQRGTAVKKKTGMVERRFPLDHAGLLFDKHPSKAGLSCAKSSGA